MKSYKEADQEIINTAIYYEERTPGLGSEFLDDIEEGLKKIEEFPLASSVYEGEFRRYVLKRFPYGIIYRVESENLFLIAVAHLHRRPGYWRIRL